MSGPLAPDTSLALLQASQGDVGKISKGLKNVKNLEKIEQTAQDFEAMFIAEMVKPMFQGISTDGLFGGGKGEEVFRGLLIQEYGKLMAQTGSVGIADHVKEHMIKVQEDLGHADHTGENTNE